MQVIIEYDFLSLPCDTAATMKPSMVICDSLIERLVRAPLKDICRSQNDIASILCDIRLAAPSPLGLDATVYKYPSTSNVLELWFGCG
jgi:hypothetical protein